MMDNETNGQMPCVRVAGDISLSELSEMRRLAGVDTNWTAILALARKGAKVMDKLLVSIDKCEIK